MNQTPSTNNNSLSVRPYSSKHKSDWDALVSRSNNATFLFYRDFMDYHGDRFEDYSLMVYKKETLVALFPAHINAAMVSSHKGLTYGGFISNRTDTISLQSYFNVIIEYLKEHGMEELYIKFMPPFLPKVYSSALEFTCYQQGGVLMRRDLNFVVDLSQPLNIHKSKLKKLKAIDSSEFEVAKTKEFASFWKELLIPVLAETYDSEPVHSLSEIENLGATFPENIIQYNVIWKGQLVAGMTLFIDQGVVKSQYGVNNSTGKDLRALDYLYYYLMKEFKNQGFRYFDMGTTTKSDGNFNSGLTRYKEEFGALPMNLDHYLITL